MSLFRRKSLAAVAASLVVGVSCAGVASMVTTTAAAHADPAFTSYFNGAGSDTIQDLFDCFAGLAQGTNGGTCAPLKSSAASGNTQLISWDAVNPSTGAFVQSIIDVFGGPAFDRPDGSKDGRTAMADIAASPALGYDDCTGTGLSATDPGCGAPAANVNDPVLTHADVAFARASSVGSGSGTTLSYVPFASDAVSYAYFCPPTVTTTSGNDCSALAHLTDAQLAAIYSTTDHGVLAGGSSGGLTHDNVSACPLQTGSGTYGFFGDETGATPGTTSGQATMNGAIANTACSLADTTGLEENNLNTFVTTVNVPTNSAFADSDWIIPVSVGQEIGQHNGYGKDRSSTGLGTAGAGIGTVNESSGVSTATTCTPFVFSGESATCSFANDGGDPTGTWTSSPTYYGSNYGRFLYVVVYSSDLSGFNANAGIESLFAGGFSNSAICSPAAQTDDTNFGFAPPNSTTGALLANSNGLALESSGTCGAVIGTRAN
jgi:hypothetical protein